MSRFDSDGDSEYNNQWELWMANANRSIGGKQGQLMLRELESALLSLPEKRLIQGNIAHEGEVCAIGALAVHCRVKNGEDRDAVLTALSKTASDYEEYDYEAADDTSLIGKSVGLSYTLAWRIAYLNDEDCWDATPEARYERVLAWVRSKIHADPVAASSSEGAQP